MDAESFLRTFQDEIAPTLDAYEQAIYIYLIRHSHLEGKDTIVVGFKSARKGLAFGIGKAGTPPSEGVIYRKVQSLQSKGLIKLLASERTGTRIRVALPESTSCNLTESGSKKEVRIDDIDFFSAPEGRSAILKREGHRCFYCQTTLNEENYVMEHVISRPAGDNSYKNIVAACRTCNNKKSETEVRAFLRKLYRDGFLDSSEFEITLQRLEALQNGDLKPEVTLTIT